MKHNYQWIYNLIADNKLNINLKDYIAYTLHASQDCKNIYIGLPSHDSGKGSVLVYTSATGSNDDWTYEPTVIRPKFRIKDTCFGNVLTSSMDGTYLAVSTLCLDYSNASKVGVYIFKRKSIGYVETDHITNSSKHHPNFGIDISMSLDGDRLIIGSPSTRTDKAGSAYIYTRSNSEWVKTIKLKSNTCSSNKLGQEVFMYPDGHEAYFSDGTAKQYSRFISTGKSWKELLDFFEDPVTIHF